MLFFQSNSLSHPLGGRARLRLLDALAARGHTPLARSARRLLFRLLTSDRDPAKLPDAPTFPDSANLPDASKLNDPAAELERLAAARPVPEGAAYTPGELFCTTDCVFFVVFHEAAGDELSAGIVYSVATAEPLARLERFCREVSAALLDAADEEPRARKAAAADGAQREAAGDAGHEAGREDEAGVGREAGDDGEREAKGGAEVKAAREAREDEAAGGGGAEGGVESGGGRGAEGASRVVTDGPVRESPHWRPRSRDSAHALARFVAARPTDFAVAAKVRSGARGLLHASELLEDSSVRSFLRRVQELRREGYSPRRLFAEAGGGVVPVEEMLAAGLLEREVRVSCRKSGHALFDLPSPDSLAAITISKAKCSLCAAPIADEVVEETINPTRLAVSLLENGGWLANRVYKIVRSLGVPESEIATAPASQHGESYLAANVCGNSFLFAARDGDLTPAFARRVAETVAETETAHLVVVTTGAIEEEGRLRLYEFAWRRARDGHDLGLTLVEGTNAARAEIVRAFETALRRELSRQLFTLNAALGLDASDFVLDWFRLSNPTADRARSAGNASAAGASNAPVALVPVFTPQDKRAAS